MAFKSPARLIAIVALAGLVLLVYWGALSAPFHFDDHLILESSRITEPGRVFDNLRPDLLRQLTYLGFHWNYRWSGTRPGGYHLVNLLLHLANGFALWLAATLLLRRRTGLPDQTSERWFPLAAAAVFALHPVQSEAVIYIYQRSSLLAALFALISLAALLRGAESTRPGLWHAAALSSYALAVASKETALVLPLVAAAYLWAFEAEGRSFAASLAKIRRAAISSALAMAGFGGWALYNLYRSGEGTMGMRLVQSAPQYLLAQVQVFAAYLRLILWPAGLSVDPAFRAAPPLSFPGIGSALLLALAFVLIARIRPVHPLAAFCGAVFIILLLPTSSIVPSRDLMFEHRLYLPMAAGSTLIAWGVFRLCAATARSPVIRAVVTAATFSALLAGYAAATWNRTETWKDEVRLWQDASQKAPWNPRAHYNLGVARIPADRNGARESFRRTLELQPDHSAAHYNLGWLDQTEGRFDSASSRYREALRADPSNWQARQNLGNVAAILGEHEAALEHFRETIKLNPDYWPAYRSLAALEIRRGDPAAALAALARLESLSPGLAEGFYLRACALADMGRAAEAESEIRRLEAADPKGDFKALIVELRARQGRDAVRPKP